MKKEGGACGPAERVLRFGNALDGADRGSAGQIAFQALADEHRDVARAGAHFRARPLICSRERGLRQLGDGSHRRIVDLESGKVAGRALEVRSKAMEAEKRAEVIRGGSQVTQARSFT